PEGHPLFHYDPELKNWYVYGPGTVNPDGAQVTPDPTTRFYAFTGAMFGGSSPPDQGGPNAGGQKGWRPGGSVDRDLHDEQDRSVPAGRDPAGADADLQLGGHGGAPVRPGHDPSLRDVPVVRA